MRKLALLTTVAVFFFVQAKSQDIAIPQIGVKAPSFTAESTNGKIKFPKDFGQHWKILLSHPKDFTPVCSSEILELAYAQKSFEELDAKLMVVSTDILEQHKSWKSALEEIQYQDRDPVKIKFPLVADNDLKVANLYGMIHSAANISENIRGVYFIDPDNTIRAIMFYPNEVGRNVEELQRTLVALQTTHAQANRVTPANWQVGDDMIVPVLSEQEKKSIGTANSPYYQWAWFMTFEKAD
jgi:peroxiredoxin (alkyl hydroperoxide reductase subunit C)